MEGRSNRKYTDEVIVAAAVTDAGFDPYEKKLLGVTAMTTLLGKKRFDGCSAGSFINRQENQHWFRSQINAQP